MGSLLFYRDIFIEDAKATNGQFPTTVSFFWKREHFAGVPVVIKPESDRCMDNSHR